MPNLHHTARGSKPTTVIEAEQVLAEQYVTLQGTAPVVQQHIEGLCRLQAVPSADKDTWLQYVSSNSNSMRLARARACMW